MRNYKTFTIFTILMSTIPFLALLFKIDLALYTIHRLIFWNQMWLILGSISGFISTALLFWNVLFGIRNITKIITHDIHWISKIHQWLGKYGIIIAIIHPILTMFGYAEKILWIIIPNISTNSDLHITYGRIAFLLLITIWITSVLFRDKIKFRPWLLIHYITYPILLLSILHAQTLGTFVLSIPFLYYLWYSLLFFTISIILYRLIILSGILYTKYSILKSTKLTNEIFEIEMIAQQNKIPVIKDGQYFYLQLKPFGETHPFSVMRIDQINKKLVFGIKSI